MRIKDIFSPKEANLSKMVLNKNNIYISNVFHKAKIEVNEQGTIAAASTGAVVIPLMGNIKPVFRADHPFIFILRHIPTGTILFAGRVSEPESAEEPVESYIQMTFPKPQSQSVPTNRQYPQTRRTQQNILPQQQDPLYKQQETRRQQEDKRPSQQGSVVYQQDTRGTQPDTSRYQGTRPSQQDTVVYQQDTRGTQQDSSRYQNTRPSQQESVLYQQDTRGNNNNIII